MPKAKSKRTPKTSSGNGMKHRKTTLTEQQKILLGGGMLRNVSKRWGISA